MSAFVALLALVESAVAAQPQSPSSSLPGHFSFGLEAGLGDTWMPESAITWDYRWQYLSGGLNTGHGWETWNPSGAFALNYANEADQHGYIPMFPYYELLQTNGDCDACPENQRTLTNLNTREVMRAYYENFALLMQRLGPATHDGARGFGKAVLVNVEPDFSGGYAVQAVNTGACFGFCSGRGNDPSLLKASVASSGHPDVAGYADTYLGYTQALAHLRDLYAPNVLLGYDVSPWATGTDIGSDQNPNLDGAALGQQVGRFLSQVGPHELLFNNPLDRDAGQYALQFNQNRWWDRDNVRFPNFARWEQYLHAATLADTSKPILLWQVPVGNQYFLTENNTDGHFQDNRAEYIFGHIPELIQAGVVGALFGPGNAGNTTHGDAKQDGVTNPAALCSTDGISIGQICNDHPSTVADDDGGFVRMAGQTYYQSPVPLSGVPAMAPVPIPASPAPPVAAQPPSTAPRVDLGDTSIDPPEASGGQDVTLQQDLRVSDDATVLVDFEVFDDQGQRVWQTWHDEKPFPGGAPSSDTAVFTIPDSLPPGQYTLKVGVFGAGWGAMYAWNDAAATLTVSSE